MGILNSTLRLQRSSLLWFALPLSPLPSQRPSQRPRLIPGWLMDMDTPMPTEPTGPTDTDTPTPTATTERDLLMLSPRPRPRLIPPSSTPPTDMLASPTLTLDSTTATLDTTLDTPMPTTERGPLMLSPRPRLIPPSSTPPTDMVPTPRLRLLWTLPRLRWIPLCLPLRKEVRRCRARGRCPLRILRLRQALLRLRLQIRWIQRILLGISPLQSTKQKLNANITPCKSDFSS